jgi:hypothetical protein
MSFFRYVCLFVGGIMSSLRYVCLFVGGIMSSLRYVCLFVGGIMSSLHYVFVCRRDHVFFTLCLFKRNEAMIPPTNKHIM